MCANVCMYENATQRCNIRRCANELQGKGKLNKQQLKKKKTKNTQKEETMATSFASRDVGR